jgi:Kef-type K+ transport system membrane component KefB
VNAPSRLDRELNELLQELRVVQGGILLLVGFLLVIAFSSGFERTTPFDRIVYFLTLLVTGLSALVVVAPVVHHRMAFRKHDKERVIVRGNIQILIAIFLVALSILGIAVLISDFMYGIRVALAVAVAYTVITVTLWWLMPRHSLRRAADEHHLHEHHSE